MNLRTDLNKIWAFAARSLLVNRRNVFAVFEMFFWPGISIFSVGLLTKFLKLDEATVTFILIGAVGMNTIQIAQLDLSYAMLYDVWSKSLRHNFIAPIGLPHILLGTGLVGLMRGLVVFVAMVFFCTWLFAMDLSLPGLTGLAVFLAGMFLNAVILGILVVALVLRFGQRAEVAAWAFSYLLFLALRPVLPGDRSAGRGQANRPVDPPYLFPRLFPPLLRLSPPVGASPPFWLRPNCDIFGPVLPVLARYPQVGPAAGQYPQAVRMIGRRGPHPASCLPGTFLPGCRA